MTKTCMAQRLESIDVEKVTSLQYICIGCLRKKVARVCMGGGRWAVLPIGGGQRIAVRRGQAISGGDAQLSAQPGPHLLLQSPSPTVISYLFYNNTNPFMIMKPFCIIFPTFLTHHSKTLLGLWSTFMSPHFPTHTKFDLGQNKKQNTRFGSVGSFSFQF